MFLKEFEDGKRYRFNNEIYSNYMESIGWANNNSWNVLIHLQEVTTIDDSYGYIECYLVSPEWCEEIIEGDEKILLDKFEVGKRYRFNKELLSKDIESNGLNDTNGWEDDIHLHEVTTLNDTDGYAGDYLISPAWCEEIVTEPLKTRDDIKDMYKQVLYLEELEETLDAMDEDMSSSHINSNFIEFIKGEIERVIDELGLEE